VAATCDRCGKIEKLYRSDQAGIGRWGQLIATQPNGPDYLGSQQAFNARDAKDLCPECMKALRAWFGGAS